MLPGLISSGCDPPPSPRLCWLCVQQALGELQSLCAKDALVPSPALSSSHSSLCLGHHPHTSHPWTGEWSANCSVVSDSLQPYGL